MRRFVISVMLLCGLGVGCGAGLQAGSTPNLTEQADSWTGAQLYAAGLRFMEAADLVRAEQYLASALRNGHAEHACVKALLETTVRASRLRSALSYAEPYLDRHPGDIALRQLVATLHLVLGELALAERDVRRVLLLKEFQADAHYLLALVLERRGDVTEARRQAMERYLALAPQGRHAEEVRAGLLEITAPTPRTRPRSRLGPREGILRKGV